MHATTAQLLTLETPELRSIRETLLAELANLDIAYVAPTLTATGRLSKKALTPDQEMERASILEASGHKRDMLHNVERELSTRDMDQDAPQDVDQDATPDQDQDAAAVAAWEAHQDQDAPQEGSTDQEYHPLAGVGQPFPDGTETDQDAPQDQDAPAAAPQDAPAAAPAAKLPRATQTMQERNADRWAWLQEADQDAPDLDIPACHWCKVAWRAASVRTVGTDGRLYHKVCAEYIKRAVPGAAKLPRAATTTTTTNAARLAALESTLAAQNALLAALAAQFGVAPEALAALAASAPQDATPDQDQDQDQDAA